MDRDFYHKQLYPFQDRVLRVFTETDTGFYLGGGTALSRGYIDHLFSDDLDLFVNDDSRFSLWADRIIQSLTRSPDWRIQINLREERLVRLDLTGSEIDLKIEMINDVPARVGEPWMHPILGRLDTAKNILANKITAVLD